MFEKEAEEYANKWLCHVKDLELYHKKDDKPEYIRILEAYQKGAEFGYNKANEWHKLDLKQDYPKLNRLVRVRTQSEEEYICETYAYQPTEDEIGYETILTQFEQLNGDWVDDNEIEYWCYIEPFKEQLCLRKNQKNMQIGFGEQAHLQKEQ